MDDQVQEGELAENTPAPTGTQMAEELLSLGNLINNHIQNSEVISKQIRELQEGINNVLENDATFKQHSEAAKEASRVKGNTRKEILKRPEVAHVVAKLKEAQEELKDQRITLSELLQEYQRQTGSTTLEGPDGKVREIVSTSRLVARG